MKYTLVFCIFSLILPLLAKANLESNKIVEIDISSSHINLIEHAEYIRTRKGAQLSEVQGLQGWQAEINTVPLADEQAQWLRVAIDYQESQPSRFVIVVGNPSLDYVDAYVLDNKNRILESYTMGAKRLAEQRPYHHRNFVLPVDMTPKQMTYVYMRIRDDGPTVFSLDIWRGTSLIAEEQFHLAFIGIIVGALAILCCYFLVTYILLRSPVRFWFAIANASLLLLFLNVHGILSQLTGLGAYIAHTSSVLVGLTILAAAKVSHNMLLKIPFYLRWLSYLLALSMLIISVLANTYWQILLGFSICGAALLLQVLYASIFHNRSHSIPNRLYAFGWLIIAATAMFSVGQFLSGNIVTADFDLVLSFIVLSGVLVVAVAIESHEQAVTRTEHAEQQSTISNLNQFYELFKNSAEGLYTSTLDGTLVSVNPAMCKLFDYANEKEMIEQVQNTGKLYANIKDRDLLLGLIYDQDVVLGKEIKGVRKDGSEFWFSLSMQLSRDGDQEYLFGSIFDVTERKQSSINLEYLATHDSLTGVYNRREFEQKLTESIRRAKQQKQAFTLLYMDLDRFKVVNDACGHKAGDSLIKQLSQQLNDAVMKHGLLARLGGDEFGVLLLSDDEQDAKNLATSLLELIDEFKFVWGNRIFTMGLSIGIAKWVPGVDTPEHMLSMADTACYMSKEQGRNQVHVYTPEDPKAKRYESELKWVSVINQALEQGEFLLYYQHYYPLKKVVSGYRYEILLRMKGEDGVIVKPESFLPSAERYSLTAEIDKWVIQHYFEWLSGQGDHINNLERCNINLSGHSLADKELKSFVLDAFKKYQVPYDKICFEITETMAIVKMEETLKFIQTFSQLGCAFALDDFGSGFSSYSYLKNFPVDSVKIDGSFVRDSLVDRIDMAMVCSMKDVAKAMGMETVAECVESKDTMIELGKVGIDYAQGYGISKPAPLNDFKPCKIID